MAKIDLTTVAAGTNAVTVINANNAVIEAASDDFLSRSGATPNQMESAINMNSNRITNLPRAIGSTEPVTLVQLEEAVIAGGGGGGSAIDDNRTYATRANAAIMSVDPVLTFATGYTIDFLDPIVGGRKGLVCVTPGIGGVATFTEYGTLLGGLVTSPATLVFPPLVGAALSQVATSDVVIPADVNTITTMQRSSARGEFSVDGAAWRTSITAAYPGDSITLRHTASSEYSTSVRTGVIVGATTGTFTSTTIDNPVPVVIEGSSYADPVLTITGHDFGAKATAPPVYFQPFVGIPNGTLCTDPLVGMDFEDYSDFDGGVPSVVTDTDGIGGGSLITHCLGYSPSHTDWLMHLAKFFPPQQELVCSYWCRIQPVLGATAASVQMKWIRAGKNNGAGGSPAVYGSSPRINGSLWLPPSGVWSPYNDGSAWLEYHNQYDTFFGNYGLAENGYDGPYVGPMNTGWGSWFHNEAYYKFNDLGQANSVAEMIVNGTRKIKVSDFTIRVDADQLMDYVNWLPLLDNIGGADLDLYLSRFYLDNTAARVFLTDAATIAASTGRFLLPPITWTGGNTITAGSCTDVPVGYDWVYVVRADNTVSNGWRWRGP